jgi:hypothetical protein
LWLLEAADRHRSQANLLQVEDVGDYQHLADKPAFKAYLTPLWRTD